MIDIHETKPKATASKRELYENQVQLLKTFFEHGAISQSQYDKSFHDLTEKMGFSTNGHPSQCVSCCGSSGTDS